MKFNSKEHEQFFYTLVNSCKNNDTYHLSLFYTLGKTKTVDIILMSYIIKKMIPLSLVD